MRILVAAVNDMLADYLQNAGHRTKLLYVNDLALRAAQEFKADVVLYQTTVTATVNHGDVIKELQSNGFRVVLVANPNDPLVIYALALEIKDLLLFPVDPAAILHRIENPATIDDVAQIVRKFNLKDIKNQSESAGKIKNEKQETKKNKPGFFSRFRRIAKEKEQQPNNDNNDNDNKQVSAAEVTTTAPVEDDGFFPGEVADQALPNDDFFTLEQPWQSSPEESAPPKTTGAIPLSIDNAAIKEVTNEAKHKPDAAPDKFFNEKPVKLNGFLTRVLDVEDTKKHGRQLARCNVIAIGCPGVSGGASSIASSLAITLAQGTREKISAFDCDLEGRGLGVRMGAKLVDLENWDWRKSGVSTDIFGVCLYSLDPSRDYQVNEEYMAGALQRACLDADRLILDLGANMSSWWFRCGFDMADVMFWVIKNDPLLLGKARPAWETRPKAGCREFLILFGDGNPGEMEEIFMLPCIQVSNEKGFKRLKELLEKNKFSRGHRVLVVGFKKIPKVDGLVFDVFSTAEEAMVWVKCNVPDMAVLADNLEKVSLLEYDLKKIGVLVKRVNGNELAEALDALLGLMRHRPHG
jgi:DNA-binding NarL/FixJ family response regulator